MIRRRAVATGKQVVVNLTMSIQIRFPDERQVEIDAESVRIGSEAACEVAFPNDLRVKPRHAVIRRVSGRWMIEAEGDGSVQVGAQAPARMRWLTAGDVVRLTSDGPEFVFQPQRAPQMTPALAGSPATDTAPLPAGQNGAGPAGEPTPAAITRERSVTRGHSVRLLTGAGIVAVLLVCVAAGLFWKSGTGTGDESKPGDAWRIESGQQKAQTKPPAGKERSQPPDIEAGAARVTSDARSDRDRALYLVTIKDPQQGQVYQLGTAWAAARRTLVTSAGVIGAVQELRDVLPIATVNSPTQKRELEIAGMKVHPAYLQANADAKAAQQEAETLRLDLEQNKDPEQIDAITQKIIAAEERRFQSLERQVFYDVGVIEVGGELAEFLPIATGATAKSRPGSEIVLAGVPFQMKKYLLDPEHLTPPFLVEGNVLALQQAGEGSPGVQRMLLKCRADLSDQNWSGSAVLNSTHEVVGVYSRPTPPRLDPRPAVDSHDAAQVERLREFAADMK